MIKNDMLVNLLKLPPLDPILDSMRQAGVVIRRANTFEATRVLDFVETEFSEGWADEVHTGLFNKPTSVWIAIRDKEIIGFSAYECTRLNYFGPTGVAKDEQGKGIGKALLIAGLHGLKELGYAYGIIGSADNPASYTKAVGAVEIHNSAPGIYADPIKK